MRAPPAYQEYPSDLLANESYKLMQMEERGIFHTLRHLCWVNGSIPKDTQELSELLGLTASHVDMAFSPRVRQFFCPSPTEMDRLISPELFDYRQELQNRSLRKIAAGRLGGLKSAEIRALSQARLDASAQATGEES